jgi:hypothetical protein
MEEFGTWRFYFSFLRSCPVPVQLTSTHRRSEGSLGFPKIRTGLGQLRFSKFRENLQVSGQLRCRQSLVRWRQSLTQRADGRGAQPFSSTPKQSTERQGPPGLSNVYFLRFLKARARGSPSYVSKAFLKVPWPAPDLSAPGLL